MKPNETKSEVTVILAKNATEKQHQLADWLVNALADLDVEVHLEQDAPDGEDSPEEHHEQSVPDQGKPKTPLPDQEEPSSQQDLLSSADEDWADDLFPLEPDEDRESAKERTRGFLIGLFTAWLVTGAGVLLFRLARTALDRLAQLTDIPFDVLVGLCMLSALALFLRRKTRQFVARIADWFDFDF